MPYRRVYDIDDKIVSQRPGAFKEFVCMVCKKIKYCPLDSFPKTCSEKCSKIYSNTAWRYKNIPSERDRICRYMSDYNKGKKHSIVKIKICIINEMLEDIKNNRLVDLEQKLVDIKTKYEVENDAKRIESNIRNSEKVSQGS